MITCKKNRKLIFLAAAIILAGGILAGFGGKSIKGLAARTIDSCVKTAKFYYSSLGSFDRSCIGEECKGESKLLFEYYGRDAKCDTGNEAEKNICRISEYVFGWPGTFRLVGNLIIHGSNIFNYGADSSGIHWIMSGLNEAVNNAIGFSKKENKVLFGRNVFLDGNFAMPDNGNNRAVYKSGVDQSSISGTQSAGEKKLSFSVYSGEALALSYLSAQGG